MGLFSSSFKPPPLPQEIRRSARDLNLNAERYGGLYRELLTKLAKLDGTPGYKEAFKGATAALKAGRYYLKNPEDGGDLIPAHERKLGEIGRARTRQTLREIGEAGSQARQTEAATAAQRQYDSAYQRAMAEGDAARSRAGLMPTGYKPIMSSAYAGGLADAENKARLLERYRGEDVRRNLLPTFMALEEAPFRRANQIAQAEEMIARSYGAPAEYQTALLDGGARVGRAANEFEADSMGAHKTILDYEIAARKAKAANRAGKFGGFGSLIGAAASFAIPGVGPILGATLGGSLGKAAGGDWQGASQGFGKAMAMPEFGGLADKFKGLLTPSSGGQGRDLSMMTHGLPVPGHRARLLDSPAQPLNILSPSGRGGVYSHSNKHRWAGKWRSDDEWNPTRSGRMLDNTDNRSYLLN